MEIPNSSRQAILNAIRANLPKQQVDHPRIPVFQRRDSPLKPEFELHLQKLTRTSMTTCLLNGQSMVATV
jgi:hypothetical protein